MLPSKTSTSKNGLHFVEVIGQRGPMETTKHHRLLAMLLVTLNNLVVRPECLQRVVSAMQLPHSFYFFYSFVLFYQIKTTWE